MAPDHPVGVAGVQEEVLAGAALAGAEWGAIVLEPVPGVIASVRPAEKKPPTRQGFPVTT
jgi:hypothetical protein